MQPCFFRCTPGLLRCTRVLGLDQMGVAFNAVGNMYPAGAIGAVVARFVHTEEVTGSNPVSPTQNCTNVQPFTAGSGRKLQFFAPLQFSYAALFRFLAEPCFARRLYFNFARRLYLAC